jgi:hypothetical protein
VVTDSGPLSSDELARRRGGPRQALIRATIADITDGAHALSELDFCWLTRRYGLPESRTLYRAAVRSGR